MKNPYTLTWDEFLQLPQVEDVSDFHCVTTWSLMDSLFTQKKLLSSVFCSLASIAKVYSTPQMYKPLSPKRESLL